MLNLIPCLVAIPLGAAFLVPLAAHRHPRRADVITLAALALLALASLPWPGRTALYHMGAWPTPLGIDLRVDALSALMLLIINGLALVCAVYAVAYLRHYTARARFFSLFLFMTAGMNGVVLSGDLFNLYVFMEIAVIASYALVAFGGRDEELEASFKYAVLGGVSSAFILIGIGLVYGMTGTLNLAQLAERLAGVGNRTPLVFAAAFFFCGFGLKAALVPFHAWLPDAHPAAPAPVSAMLSGVLIKAIGVYVLARLLFNVFGMTESLLVLLRWTGGLSMVAGGFLALGQRDIKRLLAYSSIGQVGMIVLAFGFGTAWGMVGALYHLVNHAVFKALLFLNSGALEEAAGTRDLDHMRGCGRRLPVTAATCLTGSLALTGIPPFNGFWSKLIIVCAAAQAGHLGWAGLVIVMSIITLAYQLTVCQEIFGPPGPEEPGPEPVREQPGMAAAMIALAIACMALSLLALTDLEHPVLIGPAAEVLTKGMGSP